MAAWSWAPKDDRSAVLVALSGMPRLRAVIGVFALALSACADAEATDGGDELPSPPEQDAELRCPATTAPPLTAVGPVLGSVELGPCGHLAYQDDQGQGWLIDPDATREQLDYDSHGVEFAPTGDLLAWLSDSDGSLKLRDLLGGSERLVSADADRFGFVPSFAGRAPGSGRGRSAETSFADPARGAWLWSCEQGRLERHDLAGSELVAESVLCASVVASSGSARLGFADSDGRVWLADLDEDALVGSDDLEFEGHEPEGRDDALWIDHDGVVLIHHAIEWQTEPDSDASFAIELWARVIDRHGEVILDPGAGLTARQSPRRGAPVFVFRQGEVLRFDAGDPSTVDVDPEFGELAESGELFFTTATDTVLALERSAEQPPLTIGSFHVPVELEASPDAAALAIEHQSQICIVDEQGDCGRVLMALRVWTREAGLDPRERFSSFPWEVAATLDDGSMLVVGAPVEAEGSTYEGEQPTPRALLLDLDGEIQAELPAGNGDLAIRQSFTIADDRVLFEYQGESGIGELVLAGVDIGFVSLVAGVDVALLRSWVNTRADRVAFVSEQAGADTLWYGGL
jgi:hypothetical protein